MLVSVLHSSFRCSSRSLPLVLKVSVRLGRFFLSKDSGVTASVFVVTLIYRNRSGLKNAAHRAWIGLFLRVAIFSLYRVVALG